MTGVHLTVLRDEAAAWIGAAQGRRILDGTLGAGGHTEAFLEAGADVLALDQDAQILALARERLEQRFPERLHLRLGNFRQAEEFLREAKWEGLDGLMLDLGVSSLQLDRSDRGFSFLHDGPLDMRMAPSAGGQTAADLVNTLSAEELADILFEYGEERLSRRIAKRIVEEREQTPITTTAGLAAIVERAVPRHGGGKKRIHPATRTFQALRIAVNDELGALDEILERLPRLLKPEGRAVIISFHSLEDRRVKERFKALAAVRIDPITGAPLEEPAFRILTKKPIVAGETEMNSNPRARSAKMRVLEKIK